MKLSKNTYQRLLWITASAAFLAIAGCSYLPANTEVSYYQPQSPPAGGGSAASNSTGSSGSSSSGSSSSGGK